MLLDNEGLMLLEVGVLQFKNDTSNECMLNSKHAENNKKWQCILIDLIFFNLLTQW